MRKVVLCIDKGNSHIEETISYLEAENCQIYQLKDVCENNLEKTISEIELRHGKLDILLIGASNKLPKDGTIEDGHDDMVLLSLLDEQIYDVQTVIETALPLLRKSNFKRIVE